MAEDKYPRIPYVHEGMDLHDMVSSSSALRERMIQRRSVRDFVDTPIPREVIENVLAIASSAPSGANKQPWTFCAVSDPELKTGIREAAEEEERESYMHRMNAEWLADLQPIGTDWRKPFIEIAPWIIVVFRRAWIEKENGNRGQTYYSQESVGIATGFLLSAIHQCGLVALTHTPSPMNFLQDLLKRPPNERAYMLIPVGLPTTDATVPDIQRLPLSNVTAFYE